MFLESFKSKGGKIIKPFCVSKKCKFRITNWIKHHRIKNKTAMSKISSCKYIFRRFAANIRRTGTGQGTGLVRCWRQRISWGHWCVRRGCGWTSPGIQWILPPDIERSVNINCLCNAFHINKHCIWVYTCVIVEQSSMCFLLKLNWKKLLYLKKTTIFDAEVFEIILFLP